MRYARWSPGSSPRHRVRAFVDFRNYTLSMRDADAAFRTDRAKLGPALARAASAVVDAATPSDLALPGYRLHPLKGTLKGYWSIPISGNWRLIFRFEEGDAYDVDLVDHHQRETAP